MNTKRHVLASLAAAALILCIVGLSGADLRAQGRPLAADDFRYSAPRGFGDRANGWAQAMVWWNGHLYVGTGREPLCTSLFSLWQYVAFVISRPFADTWLPYPPNNPELACPPDGTDLSLQAEIWRWTPGPDSWDRVFQSPLELDHPGPFINDPPPVGKKLPYEMTFRGFRVHVEPDGTEALYAFGVNTTIFADRDMVPPPRILRTTDGVTWTPIPQTPGTFLHDLPFNPDHSSFRSPVSYAGKLFVFSGPVFGQGSLIGSADPARGDDSWFLASSPETMFYEMAVFNGWLYLGTLDRAGYSVLKTRADGPPPYKYITVIPRGAFLPERPSGSVVSMQVYQGRLMVGTASQTEVIRINPDDTWDLLVGPPRKVQTPGGGDEWKFPLSNLDAGFGQTLNDHAWQMEEIHGNLYIGTYNASIGSRNDPVNGPTLAHNMGAHLYRSEDGWYQYPITTTGFSNLGDLYGGPFDYGIRTMAVTPHGAFFGTANDYYGLTVFRAEPSVEQPRRPAERLEVERMKSGRALLSWLPRPGAEAYQVWRAEVRPILVRDDINFEGWNGTNGNKVPDTYITPYECVGLVRDTVFIDGGVQEGRRYVYYVVAEVANSPASVPSNVASFPTLLPPMTFAELQSQIDRLEYRGRFVDEGAKLSVARLALSTARLRALACKLGTAINLLEPTRAAAAVLQPDAIDVAVMFAKLQRRLDLYRRLPQEVASTEFCVVADQP